MLLVKLYNILQKKSNFANIFLYYCFKLLKYKVMIFIEIWILVNIKIDRVVGKMFI